MTTASALVLAGHGSHRNPDSARPLYAHADRLRSTGSFSEVRAAFWKEEPSLREVLRTLHSDRVYVVPVMMSEGYFVDEVFPRELRLSEEWELDVEKTVHYTPPVGTHPSMTDVLIERAKSITDNPDIGPGVGMVIVGHGTERSPRSAATTYWHADRIRQQDRFDEVQALFMDEAPFIDDVAHHVSAPEVVVVPFFTANGYHTQEDIPMVLGIADSPHDDVAVPSTVGGQTIWYADAIGLDPSLAAVIEERAHEREAVHVAQTPHAASTSEDVPNSDASRQDRDAFIQWVLDAPSGTRRWGELSINHETTTSSRPRFAVCHQADSETPAEELERLRTPAAVRDHIRFDDSGQYRPLRGARTLPTGWIAQALDAAALWRVVEAVYPASVANWYRDQQNTLDVTDFTEAATRQTGLYSGVADVSDADVACGIRACCDDCVKRREWEAPAKQSSAARSDEGNVPCREPCSFFIAAMRAFGEVEAASDPADSEPGSVRIGAVEQYGNPYRRRFKQAKSAYSGGDNP